MGILDPKKRIMDVVLTPNGRAALATGGLNVAYASFTDGQSYYDPSSISGSYDTATDRIYFEAPGSLTQDTLAIVTDDTGKLIPVSAFGTDVDSSGALYDTTITGNRSVKGYQTGSAFSSAVQNVLNMFKTSFEYNTIIGTRAVLDSNENLSLSPLTCSFTVSSSTSSLSVSSLNSADSLIFDKRFANLPQFKFLPPVVNSAAGSELLGRFTNIKEYNSYTYETMKDEIFGTEKRPIASRRDVYFTETSETNDIVLQMYEINSNGITKLDAVDYGEINDTEDSDRPNKRVIFFGKVFTDDTETSTFVNIFTMVID